VIETHEKHGRFQSGRNSRTTQEFNVCTNLRLELSQTLKWGQSNMKLKAKSKIALVTAASCLLAMSSATAFAQGNSAFGRGQRVNHFKGRGNSAFGRANAMTHSSGHGSSAFGLGQFNGPIKGSRNSTFAHGGQTFTRSGMGTWGGQHWGRRNWSGGNWGGQRWAGRNWNGGNLSGQRWAGRNWNGGNWGGGWHNGNDIVFIGDFGFPWWWGSYSWGWGYPYGYYNYSYPYDYYGSGYGYGGYGYGDYGYGYGAPSYDYGTGYPNGGYYGSYYGGTNYGNGYANEGYYGGTGNGNDYPTHSRVAKLQLRLTRAGYYSGAIDGILGPATREAIHAWERDNGYGG